MYIREKAGVHSTTTLYIAYINAFVRYYIYVTFVKYVILIIFNINVLFYSDF